MKKGFLFFVFNCCAIFLLQAQPLQKSVTNIDPGNTKLSSATFSYRLTYQLQQHQRPLLGRKSS